MKEYLQTRVGQKLGVARAAMPKEAYFEAQLTSLAGEAAVFVDDQGREFAVPVASILWVGAPESLSDQLKKKAGFF